MKKRKFEADVIREVIMDRAIAGFGPPRPKRRKPYAVECRTVGGAPRSWRNWHVFKRYRSLKKAQQAVHDMTYKWNAHGFDVAHGWRWEFRLAA